MLTFDLIKYLNDKNILFPLMKELTIEITDWWVVRLLDFFFCINSTILQLFF